jgi:prepilin-type N-terminal cleavage/methylation domain-containing protein
MRNSSPWKHPYRSAEAGFTLIEMLIAMAVLVIGLVSLWSLHSYAIAANANSYRLGISTMLAQDGMEKLMAETFIANYTNPDLDPALYGTYPAATVDGLENLTGFLDGVGVRVNGLGNTDTSQGPMIYLRTFHVQFVDIAATDQLLIRVRVTYDDPHTVKRHGVTIATTRLHDRYDPMGLGATSGN